MNRKSMLLIGVLLTIVVALALGVHLYLRSREAAKPFWLKLGTYTTYEQFFAWTGHNETRYMTWNITRLTGDFADLHLISHGVNVTEEDVVITSGEADWTTNVVTREIVSSSDSSSVGKKCPFWIETGVAAGSTVETFYGTTVISKNETIHVLGQQRDCWVVEYNWATSSMERWYDKSSGICLKIHVVLYRQNVTIDITETAVLTNVAIFQQGT